METEQEKTLAQKLNQIKASYQKDSKVVTLPLNSLKLNVKCSLCDDMGFIVSVRDGYTFASECACRKQLIAELSEQGRLQFASFPEQYRNLDFASFDFNYYKQFKHEAYIAAKIIETYLMDFPQARDEGMGLFISSKTKGSGKTRMAATLANEISKKQWATVKFVVSVSVLDEIKRTWQNDNSSESEVLRTLSTVDVLVIDDFATEIVKEWVEQRFYSIINERYINKRVTIFTSNSKLDELKYGERIISRIRERCYQVDFPEESVRNQIAKEKNAKMEEKVRNG